MDVSLNSAVSGINVAMNRENVAAQNVVNVNTPGFAQYGVNQADVAPAGTTISSISRIPNANPSESNTDLAETSKQQIISKNSLSANATVLKVQNQMLGDLLDMVA